jgi:hypothetical protein
MIKKRPAPFESFLNTSLKRFQRHLETAGLTTTVVEARMRGARQFVRFLLGTSAKKGEQTKGRRQ